jgi:hypothetical protein
LDLGALPVPRLTIPEGVRIAYGRVELGGSQGQGKLLCMPAAGRFNAEDMRKLVRLDLGRNGVVWMACRHFLQVLRYVHGVAKAEGMVEDILRSLIGFEMYGEAESLSEWLARKGDEAFAWVCQAAILGKTGNLLECVDFCRKAAAKYPKERSFRVNGARALAGLARTDEARAFLREGLKELPDDPALAAFLKGLDAPPGSAG